MSIIGKPDELASILENLPRQERLKLNLAMQELARRGKGIPTDFLPHRKVWPLDPSGYFRKIDGTTYVPTENQRGFLTSDTFFTGFYGSRGSGKSGAGWQKSLQKIRTGYNGIVINPDFENLKISTWPVMREWMPWEMVIPQHKYRRNPEWQPNQPFKMTFINGVSVIVKGVKDPDSARGPNVNWLWYDEAQRDPDGLSWKTAVASVRVGKDPQAWATFTPNGKDHWTTEFFVEGTIPDEVIELIEKAGYEHGILSCFHGTMDENRGNLSPGFMAAMLMAYPSGWLRQQEIYGEVVEQSGVLGDRSWFSGKILPKLPDGFIPMKRVRYWDMAATEKKLFKKNDPDEMVGTLMSWDGNKTFYIENQIGGFWEWDTIKKNVLHTVEMDGPLVYTIIEEEPGSGGKNQVAELAQLIAAKFPNFPVAKGWRPPGDRVICANTWFSEAKEGQIYLIAGEWNIPFLDQLGCFPACRHDDKITSVNGARFSVAPIKLWNTIQFLHL